MKNIDVVILCGGLGKRLRPVVSDRPKPMAEVNSEPFLDTVIKYAASFGFKRFIFCTGYKAEAIKNYYEGRTNSLEFVFSQEKEPLGTGGAVKNAAELIKSDPFLVMNGDSFCDLNFCDFFKFHTIKKAVFSIALSRPKNDQNSGIVVVDRDKRIVAFKEKSGAEKGNYCNAGIYFMKREIFRIMGNKEVFSLEYDMFPALVGKDCYGYYEGNDFIDIGIPRNLAKASNFIRKARAGK
ncbi:MAG: nucleotidyltransferase family protein [Candidatus Omnitrophota bacterium]